MFKVTLAGKTATLEVDDLREFRDMLAILCTDAEKNGDTTAQKAIQDADRLLAEMDQALES